MAGQQKQNGAKQGELAGEPSISSCTLTTSFLSMNLCCCHKVVNLLLFLLVVVVVFIDGNVIIIIIIIVVVALNVVEVGCQN